MYEMSTKRVAPTLATHNAFIHVCAARAQRLTELDLATHKKLRRLNVDLNVATPVHLANQQLQTLLGAGHAVIAKPPASHTLPSLPFSDLL